MSKVKGMLEKDIMLHPDRYNHYEDYEFWMQCRKEELLEKEGKPTIKIKKGKSNDKRNKSNKI